MISSEGPDDLAALREIGMSLFGRTSKDARPPPAGETRMTTLSHEKIPTLPRVEIKVVRDAKDAIPKAVADELKLLAPQTDDRTTTIAAVYDPDGKGRAEFLDRVWSAMRVAPEWKMSAVGEGAAIARRAAPVGGKVYVRVVPWRADGPVVDGLPNHENLERLLCRVAGKAFPTEAAIVEQWLDERSAAGKPLSWKSAVHLWCALVEESASALNAATRFLHQNKACKPHVEPTLRAASLLRDLRALLG